MSRRRREAPAAEVDELEPPFPTDYRQNAKYCIYCRYPHDKRPGKARRFVWTFTATYAARRFVDTVLEGRKFKWINDHTIHTDDGIEVRGSLSQIGNRRWNDLDEIMEYEYTGPLQENWPIPIPVGQMLETFLRPWPDADHVTNTSNTSRAMPRASRDGMVPIKEICDRLGIEPREGRMILRKQNVERPAAGWAFAGDEVSRIEDLLRKGR